MADSTTITITRQDIRTSAWDLTRYMLWRPMYAVPTAIFLGSAVLFIALGSTSRVAAVSIMTIVAGAGLIALTLLLPVFIARQARRNFSAIAPAGSEFTLAADDDGLTVTSAAVSQTVAWAMFDRIRVVGSTAIIRQRGTKVIMMLPKRAFSSTALHVAHERIDA